MRRHEEALQRGQMKSQHIMLKTERNRLPGGFQQHSANELSAASSVSAVSAVSAGFTCSG